MYLYFIIFWIPAFFGYFVRDRSQNRMLAYLFAAFLVVFMGIRGDVGCDTLQYSSRFAYLYRGVGWIEAMRMGEGGFNWLNMAIIRLGLSFDALLIACALIFVACLMRFTRVVQRPLAYLVLCFPVVILQLGMSGLRQALATGFLMLAFANFVEKRRLMVAVWILVASQFHTSAIIFLPAVAIVGRKVSAVRLVAALVLVSPLLALFLGDRMEVYNNRYVAQIYGENSSSGAWTRYVLILIPFFLFEWKRRLIALRHPDVYQLLRLFAFISFALLPIGIVSSVALHRLGFYVLPFSILALLCVADSIFDRHSRQFAIAMPFVAYGAYITVWFMFSRHAAACFVPYKSWLI